ncbi:hypothetical protein RSAG8_13468, partial [Rhizoctonia solani AG-8 WAC10335]
MEEMEEMEEMVVEETGDETEEETEEETEVVDEAFQVALTHLELVCSSKPIPHFRFLIFFPILLFFRTQ